MTFKKRELQVPLPWGHVAGVVWSCNKEGNDEHMKTVIFLHGFKENAGAFTCLIQYLPKEYRYICFDIPGHGKSSHLPLPLDIIQLTMIIRLAVIKMDLKRFSLIGHSLGGGMCVLFSSLFPNMVERVFLIEGMAPFPTMIQHTVKHIRKVIDEYIDSNEPQMTSLIFKTREEALECFKEQRKKIRGSRIQLGEINDAMANHLLERILSEIPQGYKYSIDPHQHNPLMKQPIICLEQAYEILSYVKCPLVSLWASNSLDRLKSVYGEEMISTILSWADSLGFETIHIEGQHNVHQTHPEVVASYVTRFLNKNILKNPTVKSHL